MIDIGATVSLQPLFERLVNGEIMHIVISVQLCTGDTAVCLSAGPLAEAGAGVVCVL